jgi:hypothetical protein
MEERKGVWKEGRENGRNGGKEEESKDWLSGVWTFFIVCCFKQAQKVSFCHFGF